MDNPVWAFSPIYITLVSAGLSSVHFCFWLLFAAFKIIREKYHTWLPAAHHSHSVSTPTLVMVKSNHTKVMHAKNMRDMNRCFNN